MPISDCIITWIVRRTLGAFWGNSRPSSVRMRMEKSHTTFKNVIEINDMENECKLFDHLNYFLSLLNMLIGLRNHPSGGKSV